MGRILSLSQNDRQYLIFFCSRIGLFSLLFTLFYAATLPRNVGGMSWLNYNNCLTFCFFDYCYVICINQCTMWPPLCKGQPHCTRTCDNQGQCLSCCLVCNRAWARCHRSVINFHHPPLLVLSGMTSSLFLKKGQQIEIFHHPNVSSSKLSLSFSPCPSKDGVASLS